ncbi:MAG: 5'-3'-deoxyribonucleotidase [Nanoarchaeota archaeon]|nr:5'-3'-deoxyribonucleotidase [Nanoarchaeota archaeon]
MKVLVDMDDVIADYEGGFVKKWRELYPGRISIQVEQRTTWGLEKQYPAEFKDDIMAVFTSKGFIAALEPIAGGLEALAEMKSKGHDVFICSSPMKIYKHCVVEKYEWIDMHLGSEWVRRLMLTADKTMVSGDILIDDNPEIKGCAKPSWEHVLYDIAYNRSVKGKRRLTWKTWKQVLDFDCW